MLKIDLDRHHELELLARYSLTSRQQGLKLRADAEASLVAAAERLHQKGLITERDGGYLTEEGFHLAESLQKVLAVLGAKHGRSVVSHELIE
ncbi:TIGR02647 family protein [Chitinivorax sp. B]|uniref:TIGR02647 family protein n=1 Tax=Chitinivorax sp. B TaxID=2502235 RepID=UPI0010F59CC1|nr:TIGR02647 family protein [Chitinivorax sp. B]